MKINFKYSYMFKFLWGEDHAKWYFWDKSPCDGIGLESFLQVVSMISKIKVYLQRYTILGGMSVLLAFWVWKSSNVVVFIIFCTSRSDIVNVATPISLETFNCILT